MRVLEPSPLQVPRKHAMRSIALAVMQMAAIQPALIWHGNAYAQSCSASDDTKTPQDGDEGKTDDAAPQDNSPPDPDVPAPAPDPTGASAEPDDGDASDGGGATGDPSGTDSSGGEWTVAGGDSGSDWDGIGGGGGGGGGGYHFDVMLDPIDLRLADKVHVQLDYVSRGSGPVRMARVYHSNGVIASARATVPMGTGWHMYYDRSLSVLSGTQIRLHRANGRTLDFSWNGSAWISAMPAGVLTSVGGGWNYVNKRDGLESYDTNGRLLSLGDAGLVSSMAYDASGRLIRVSNPFGRSLALAYDGAGRVSTVTLPDGNTLGYGYDGQNNLTSVRFADNATRQYAYENTSFPNALTGVVDETGRRRLTWGYDGAGRPISGYYGTGTGSVTASYAGNQVTTTDARGAQRVRTFATAGSRPVLTALQTAATPDSAATGWSFSYDGNGNPTSIVTRAGEVQQTALDSRGRLTSMTRASGTSSALSAQKTWHATFHKPVQTVTGGVTTNYTIDGAGRVTQVAKSGNGTSSTPYAASYNAQNLLQSVTDARGVTTNFTYDTSGNLTSTTNTALNQTTYYQNYTAHGQPTRIQRPDGTVVTRSYDTRARMVSRTDPEGTTQYAYDSAGRIASITAPDSSWKSFGYDTGGFLTTLANNRGETTSLTRDAVGKVTKRSTYNASGGLTAVAQRQLDAVGRVSATVDSRGYRTQYLYGIDGRPNAQVNAVNQSTSLQLDPLNRVTTITQPNTTAMRQGGGAATVSSLHAYDSRSNRLSAVDTNSVATGYAYDGLNRRTGESGNDAGSKGVVRNAAGDVTSFTDPRGVTMTVNYDAIGRMSSTMFAGATDRTYSYVAGHSDNLLSSMTDALGGNTWTYDAAGRVLTQKQTVYGVTRTVTVARDTLGRPTSITYPSGMVVGISYGADVVTSLTVNSTTLLNNVSYIPQSGVATGWRWGNGTGYSRALDADGRVASVTLGSIQRSYGFDAAGRITTQTDTGSFGTRQSTYAYDEAGQLTSYAPATGSGQSFAYDTNGNRRSQVVNGVASNSSYAANTNRLSSWYGGAMQYNADGSPSSGPGGNYYYDSYGRLGSITNSSNQAFYNYNGLGQRVLKRLSIYVECGTPAAVKPVATGLSKANPTPAAAVSGTCNHWPVVNTVRYMYDFNGHIIGEYDSVTGYSQETVWFNGQPVATVQGGKVYYINADNLGTPRSIVRASDNVELWRWDSDPFGTTYPTAPNPSSGSLVYNLRFPGQVYDSETGFHYNGMRDYVPSTGRYLEPDPIGLAGGLSRYAYVGANPLKGADPLGEAGVENVVGAVAGAVGGGVVNGLNYYSQGCSFGKGFVNGAIGGTVGGFIFPSSPTTGGALGSGLTQVLNRLDGVSAFSNPVADIAFASVLGAVFSWAGTASGTAAAPTSSSLAAAIGALTSSSNANTGNIWANVGSTIGGTTPPSCHK